MNFKKILVIGASGSGKSTLAKQIADQFGITYVPTDPFYWEKDWKPVANKIVYEHVLEVLQGSDWVMDGNFDNHRDDVWFNADCIIWLNLPFIIVAWRIITRDLHWWLTQKEVWSGNRMTFSFALNGIRHSLCSYWKKKRDYPVWLRGYENVIVFTSSRQVRKLLRDD